MLPNDISYSTLGYIFLGVALLMLHLYWWMLGVGVLLVLIDEVTDMYDHGTSLPSNPFARHDDDDQ